MTDPVLALLILIGFSVGAIVVRFFRTLDADIWDAARNPLLAGVVAGALLVWSAYEHPVRPVATSVLLTLAALYSRLTGDETEPVDGMLLGALSGAAAATPLIIFGDTPLRMFSECVLAGAAGGFGITFAAAHVAQRTRQALWDLATGVAAVGAATVPELLVRLGASERDVAIGVATVVPFLVIAAVFRQWPDVRAQLRHEASLGFIDDEDVRTTAHPLLRLGRGGWTDGRAHREFVRIANLIALRKRQLRNRPETMARLYQLEVIKLRMQLQNMSRIEHLTALRRANEDPLGSDTMRTSE